MATLMMMMVAIMAFLLCNDAGDDDDDDDAVMVVAKMRVRCPHPAKRTLRSCRYPLPLALSLSLSLSFVLLSPSLSLSLSLCQAVPAASKKVQGNKQVESLMRDYSASSCRSLLLAFGQTSGYSFSCCEVSNRGTTGHRPARHCPAGPCWWVSECPICPATVKEKQRPSPFAHACAGLHDMAALDTMRLTSHRRM